VGVVRGAKEIVRDDAGEEVDEDEEEEVGEVRSGSGSGARGPKEVERSGGVSDSNSEIGAGVLKSEAGTEDEEAKDLV
jgi:hypothetical protein